MHAKPQAAALPLRGCSGRWSVCRPPEPRSASGYVTIADAAGIGADPKGIQRTVAQVEAEAYRLVSQGGEPGAPNVRQPDVARAGMPAGRSPANPADVKIQLVPDHKTTAAGRLHVAPVPRLLVLRHPTERAPIRARPVKAIAAEAGAD